MSECQVILNNSAPLPQIAKVAAILLGAQTSIKERHGMNALFVHDTNISLQTYVFDERGSIKTSPENNDGYDINYFMPYYALQINNVLGKQYLYTINMHHKDKLLYTFHDNAHVLNIALFTQLVHIFGGQLYYRDENNTPDIIVDDGIGRPGFNHFYSECENFLRSIKPLNAALLQASYQYASYKDNLANFCQDFDAIYLKRELELQLPILQQTNTKRKI